MAQATFGDVAVDRRETLQYQGAQYATFVVEQSHLSAQLLARLVDLTGQTRKEVLDECRAERQGG